MNTLTASLWSRTPVLAREGRGQRSASLGLALVVVLTSVALSQLARRPFLSDPLARSLSLWIGYTAALVVLGSEIVAAGRSRGTLSSLRRSPAGLAAAFRAKLIVFLGSILAAPLACLWLTSALLGGRSLDKAGELSRWLLLTPEPFAAWTLPALGLALWVFSTSCWVPSGALALPAALGLTVPFGCIFWFGPGWFGNVGPNPIDAVLCTGALVVSGGAAARTAFVRGLAHADAPQRALVSSLAAAGLVLAPALALTCLRPDATQFDPSGDHVRVRHAVVTPDGDHALLRVVQWSGHSTSRSGLGWTGVADLLPSRPDPDLDFLVEVDLATGRFQALSPRDASYGEWIQRYEDAASAAHPELDHEALGLPSTAKALRPLGLGWCVQDLAAPGSWWVYDPNREIALPMRSPGPDFMHVIVRRRDWLVLPVPGKPATDPVWMSFDPREGSLRPHAGLGRQTQILRVLEDEDLLVNSRGGAAILGADLKDSCPLVFADGRRVEFVWEAGGNRSEEPGEPPLLIAKSPGSAFVLARLDEDSGRVVPLTTPEDQVLAVLGTSTDGALVLERSDGALLRALPGQKPEQLFPPAPRR